MDDARLLEQFAEKSRVFSVLHARTGAVYYYVDKAMGMFTGVVSVLASTLVTLPMFSKCAMGYTEKIVYASVLGVSSMTTFVQQFLDLAHKSERSTEYSRKYKKLYSEIYSHIHMREEYRDKDFLLKILKEMQTLEDGPRVFSFIGAAERFTYAEAYCKRDTKSRSVDSHDTFYSTES